MFRLDRRAYDGLDPGRRRRSNARQRCCSPSSRATATPISGWRNCSGQGDLHAHPLTRARSTRWVRCRRRSTSLRLSDFSNPAPRTSPSSSSPLRAHGEDSRRAARPRAQAALRGLERGLDAMLDEAAAEPRKRGAPVGTHSAPPLRVFLSDEQERDGSDNWYSTPYAERAA